MSTLRAAAVAAAGAIAMAGCAGFPGQPAHPDLKAAVPLTDVGAAGGGRWPTAQWWQRYQDPTLDALVERALANAPSLQSAHARFDAARESVRLAGASAGVQVALAGDVTRQRLSDNGLIPPGFLGYHWYDQSDLGLQFSYTFDWWGKQRGQIGAALDEAQASAAERSAAALVVASAVADTYFGWQSDQQHLAIARAQLDIAQRLGAIAADRLQAELEAREAVQHADLAVAAARDQVAALEGSARLRVVVLAALTGSAATDLPPLEAHPLPQVDAALPDDVRLDLIARRADITASRWRVEAALKGLQSARADFYPDISINALAGVSSVDVSRLLEGASRAPQAGIAVHLPIFDSGALQAVYRGREAQLRAAVAAYDQTLVDAARDVASAAATRRQLGDQRTQRVAGLRAAEDIEEGAAAKLRQGLTDVRAELAAEQSMLQQRDALLSIDAQALSADIGLQRALGGGYSGPPGLAQRNR